MTEIQDKIFNFAYLTALRDATLQKAFEGKKTYLNECVDAREEVKKYINSIFAGEKADFDSTAEKVEDIFEQYIHNNGEAGQKFTFGNTQKLINMTAKYMFIAVYGNESQRGNFSQCHCPMDGIMIEKAIEEIDKQKADKNAEISDEILSYINRMGWKIEFRKPWSRITSEDKRQYEMFQLIISFLAEKEGLSPLEYDFVKWGN